MGSKPTSLADKIDRVLKSFTAGPKYDGRYALVHVFTDNGYRCATDGTIAAWISIPNGIEYPPMPDGLRGPRIHGSNGIVADRPLQSRRIDLPELPFRRIAREQTIGVPLSGFDSPDDPAQPLLRLPHLRILRRIGVGHLLGEDAARPWTFAASILGVGNLEGMVMLAHRGMRYCANPITHELTVSDGAVVPPARPVVAGGAS